MRPVTAASWLPSSATEVIRRRMSQHSFGLAPYPTTSPRQATRSTPRSAMTRSTSVRASRLAWTSLRTAMRISALGDHREDVDVEVVEVGEPPELGVAGPDLVRPEFLQPVEAEALHGVAREHAAHHDGPPHGGDVERPGAGQVAHESPGEAVAGAGRVEELRQGV